MGKSRSEMCGKAICVAMYQNTYIALGTSKALIVLFDKIKKDVRIFGDENRAIEYHEVQCIDFSPDGNYLIAGYTMGQVTFWDIPNKNDIKNVVGIFLNPVTHIKCWGDQLTCIVADSSGALFQFSYVKKYYILDSLDKVCIMEKIENGLSKLDIIKVGNESKWILAIGEKDQIKFLTLSPMIQVCYNLQKPSIVQVDSFPYFNLTKSSSSDPNSKQNFGV